MSRVAASVVTVDDLPASSLHLAGAQTQRAQTIRFQLCSEILGQIPFHVGVLARRQFYQRELQSCHNLVTRLGVVFIYPEASIGDNVLLGRDVSVGLVTVG